MDTVFIGHGGGGERCHADCIDQDTCGTKIVIQHRKCPIAQQIEVADLVICRDAFGDDLAGGHCSAQAQGQCS